MQEHNNATDFSGLAKNAQKCLLVLILNLNVVQNCSVWCGGSILSPSASKSKDANTAMFYL